MGCTSCEWEAGLQMHVYSHMCAQADGSAFSALFLWGVSPIFPLLSAVTELPVLLERLPNMLIGTPAMIKKKFQIRATML